MAVMNAVSIPSSQRARRSIGGPPPRSPAAPPMTKGAKTAPFRSCSVAPKCGIRKSTEVDKTWG